MSKNQLLTLESTIITPKDARRQAYAPGRQDHGTKGNSYSRKDTYYTEARANAQRATDQAERQAARLEAMTPRQLEFAADTILRQAGVEIHEDTTQLVPESPVHTTYTGMPAAAGEIYIEKNPLDDAPDELASYDPHLAFADEFQAALLAGKAHKAMTEPGYHGTPGDNDLPDYLDGFHITDRP